VEERGWKQHVVGGLWVHWVQRRMDPEMWGKLFEGNKRCLIRRPAAITSNDVTPRNVIDRGEQWLESTMR